MSEISTRVLGFHPTATSTPKGFRPGAPNEVENRVLNLLYKKKYQIQDVL